MELVSAYKINIWSERDKQNRFSKSKMCMYVDYNINCLRPRVVK